MSVATKNKINASAAIDASNDSSILLDYCYTSLEKFEDAIETRPRGKIKKDKETEKYKTNGIKFAYNQLGGYDNFTTTINKLIVEPQALELLDLSFNELSTIDPVLLDFPNLKILCLQGNNISDLHEIDKLAALPNLHTISLQGNPIEDDDHFKCYTTSKLLHLKKFNSAPLTKQDKACSHQHQGKSKKKAK